MLTFFCARRSIDIARTPITLNPGEHLTEETHMKHSVLSLKGQASYPSQDRNVLSQTPSRYWKLFNDLGLSLLGGSVAQPAVSLEAFFSLTQQVQALIGMIQSIISLIP
ncbi:hypothetical protein GW17_00020009 [Ensete ventricosum]|nr:hypothetical protein GW17_00020009 [Ensete ventricosum]